MTLYTMWDQSNYFDLKDYYDGGAKYEKEEIVDRLQKIAKDFDGEFTFEIIDDYEDTRIEILMKTSEKSPHSDEPLTIPFTVYPHYEMIKDLKELAYGLESLPKKSIKENKILESFIETLNRV